MSGFEFSPRWPAADFDEMFEFTSLLSDIVSSIIQWFDAVNS
jgi:hypothetical protein